MGSPADWLSSITPLPGEFRSLPRGNNPSEPTGTDTAETVLDAAQKTTSREHKCRSTRETGELYGIRESAFVKDFLAHIRP
ncbi:hypothetical protein BKA93DRAFT_222371 [Sparassis latifolia]